MMKAKELTDLAIEWLEDHAPDSIIVTEMSVANWGGARIDVAAITDQKIIGVEIKGEGDSHTRLKLQGVMYGAVAKEMWLLPDESLQVKCNEHRPCGWGALSIENGQIYEAKRSYPQLHLSPYQICGTLWKSELFDICKSNNIEGVKTKLSVDDLTNIAIDNFTVNKLHDEMIKQLRSRKWLKPVIDLRNKKPAAN